MKLPAGIQKSAAKFNQMSVRERALTTGAGIAALSMIWVLAVYDPITAQQRALSSELSSIEESLSSTLETLEHSESNNPAATALSKERSLQKQLEEINAQLDSQSAGLIPPDRMVEVIHDVLHQQRGVKLISLHNKPLTQLIQPVKAPQSARDAVASTETAEADRSTPAAGPYMHPVELVVEGRYLDVLAYLRALEGLDWHFYWKTLELQSTEFPLNRVRIELSTLSMDQEWIGLSASAK